MRLQTVKFTHGQSTHGQVGTVKSTNAGGYTQWTLYTVESTHGGIYTL